MNLLNFKCMKKILLIAAIAVAAMGCCKKAAKAEAAQENCCPKTECVEKKCCKADSCAAKAECATPCQKADSCCKKAECPKADSCCVKAECPAQAAE